MSTEVKERKVRDDFQEVSPKVKINNFVEKHFQFTGGVPVSVFI